MTADGPRQDMDIRKDRLHSSPSRVGPEIRSDDPVLSEAIILPQRVSITRYSQLAEHLNQSGVLGTSFAAAFRKFPFFDCPYN